MKCCVATSLSADNGFISFWRLVGFSNNAVKISYCAGNGCFESKQEITLGGGGCLYANLQEKINGEKEIMITKTVLN